MKIHKLKTTVLNFLFPINCLNCNSYGQYLCRNCVGSIKIINTIIYSTSSIKNLTNSSLSGIVATCNYKDSEILRKAVHFFKYKRIKKIGEPLGALMQSRIEKFLNLNPGNWLVLPLPLHKRKFYERGFNQNDILIKNSFLKFKNLTVLTSNQSSLKRNKYTGSQTKLTGKERLRNVQSVFTVTDTAQAQNRRIIVVDDIITTGATLLSAASALKLAGAREVWGFVLARD